jgi:GNAT superfamily N-acetyltransferase
MIHEWQRDDYTVSTDPARLQLDVIHGFLTGSYWAAGIPRETVERSVRNSLCYGVYLGDTQVGFGRLVTDFATFAYVADVFVLDAHRSRGLAKWMARCMVETPELQGLRRWLLATRDAHAVYRSVGFETVTDTSRFMQILNREVYR